MVCLVLGFLSVFQLVHGSTPFGIDGSIEKTAGAGVTSFSSSFTTSYTNDVVILTVGSLNLTGSYNNVSSITSSPSLTWSCRGNFSYTNTYYYHIEEWYTTWSSKGSLSITIYMQGTVYWAYFIAFGISSANTATIFDSDLPSPVSGSGYTSAPYVSVSTNNANDMIIGGITGSNSKSVSAGSGYSSIQCGTGYGTENQTVSTTQNSLSVAFSISAQVPCVMFGDAVEAASTGQNLSYSPNGSVVANTMMTTSGNEKGYLNSAMANASGYGSGGKESSFSVTSTANISAPLVMLGYEAGYVLVGLANVSQSSVLALERALLVSGNLSVSALSVTGKEIAVLVSSLANVSAVGMGGKESVFVLLGMANLSAFAVFGHEASYLVNALANASVFVVMSHEAAFLVSGFANASALSKLALESAFLAVGNATVSALAVLGNGLGYIATGMVSGSAYMILSKESGYTVSSLLNASAYAMSGLTTAFSVAGNASLSALEATGKELGFLISSALNVSGLATFVTQIWTGGINLFYSLSSWLNISAIGTVTGQEFGYGLFGVVKAVLGLGAWANTITSIYPPIGAPTSVATWEVLGLFFFMLFILGFLGIFTPKHIRKGKPQEG